MKGLRVAAAMAVMAISAASSPALAGMYTDDLSRCLVEKTSPDDRGTLVKWMFVAMSQNPAVSSLTKVTAADIETHNQAAGALFMRLMTQTCVDPAKKAIQYEGVGAIQGAFQVLGQVAARDLMASPDVAKVMAGLEKYMDSKKLEALSTPAK